MIQITVDSNTKDANPAPAIRSGDNWYKVDNEFGQAGTKEMLPPRFSVVQIEPYQGADGQQHFKAYQMITPPPPKSNFAGGGGGGGKKGGYDSLGNQVGNAVTNATNLMIGGIVQVPEGQLIQTMTKLASQIMKVGDKVRAMQGAPVQPTQPVPQAPVQIQQPAQQPVQQPVQQTNGASFDDFDDDIPFS